MDRAAKLVAEARDSLEFEKACGGDPVLSRLVTRNVLSDIAEDLGFAPNEISAAIDEAIAAAEGASS